MEQLILVDEHGRTVGHAEKLAVHRDGGRLHRAFSIFVFDARGRTLLQRRAEGKYHFAGLWSNACCGHPLRCEGVDAAAHRRLGEELGFDTELEERFAIRYEASDPRSGLCEREYDHVFVGRHDGPVHPAPEEISEIRWVAVGSLQAEIDLRPADFTPWLRLILPRLLATQAN